MSDSTVSGATVGVTVTPGGVCTRALALPAGVGGGLVRENGLGRLKARLLQPVRLGEQPLQARLIN